MDLVDIAILPLEVTEEYFAEETIFGARFFG
jgi:hypothetical protein